MTSPDLAVEDVIDALDSFYCHNHVVAVWADAVANRLEGPRDLPAQRRTARGRRLRARSSPPSRRPIGDLGGAVTGDPRQILDRARRRRIHHPGLLRPARDRHLRRAAPRHHHHRIPGIPRQDTRTRRRELRAGRRPARRRDPPAGRRRGCPGSAAGLTARFLPPIRAGPRRGLEVNLACTPQPYREGFTAQVPAAGCCDRQRSATGRPASRGPRSR